MPFDDNEQTSSKNFVIAMIVFMAIMFGYEYFADSKKPKQAEAQKTEQIENSKDKEDSDDEADNVSRETLSVEDALNRSSRIPLENDHIIGSIDLNGGIIDSIVLKDYKETTEKDSKNIMLLSPKDTEKQFYYAITYVDKTNKDSVSDSTVWASSNKDSGNKQSLILKTQTQNGLIIERSITIDDGYYIKIRDKVLNISSKKIKLQPRSELIKSNPELHNYAIVREGLVGCSDGKIEEIKYNKIGSKQALKGNGGWLGYTDLYWLCAVTANDTGILKYEKNDENTYRISTQNKTTSIEPNSMKEFNYSIFAGPKEIKLLKNYRDNEGLDKFDMAIDFGWFFMITKPLIQLVGVLSDLFSNMGFVILLLTLLFRIITYPLMKKSFISAARMREVQPKITMLQRTYAHDKMRMNQEMMMLYKREKISPMSGCLPMLLQTPIFFCLYKVFYISIEMRHAPLFGWIHDLSAPDPLYLFNLFGLISWDPPSFLKIGVWPLIMGLTMYLQQKLSTTNNKMKAIVEKTSEQKMQENMMLFMPILFTYICASFPVAVVIYWTISNIFSMIQQYYVNKTIGKRG